MHFLLGIVQVISSSKLWLMVGLERCSHGPHLLGRQCPVQGSCGQVEEEHLSSCWGVLRPKTFDCLHVVDLMKQKYPEPRQLKSCMEGLYQRAKQIHCTWVDPAPLNTVPAVPGPQRGATEGWLFIWQLAHEDGSSMKGRSNMVHILEIEFSILENTFNSVQNPLDLLFHAPAGSNIEDFSVKFSVGFGRSLALKLVLLAMLDFNNEELKAVFPVRCSLFSEIHLQPSPNEDMQRHRSLAAKFQISESARPDPIQIYHVLAESLAKAGQGVCAGLPAKIKQYNSLTSVQSQNISDLESRVICLLRLQTKKFVEILKYHWQSYKNAESALPMKLFGRVGIFSADVPPEATWVWKDILKPSPERNECCSLGCLPRS